MSLYLTFLPSRCVGGVTPSGVLLEFPIPEQYTSYQTGDEGWRIQDGWYDYDTKPANPEKIAALDMTLGANYWWRLATPLTVGGITSAIRFVDVNGVQVWGATDNVSKITIDKLTGLGFYRLETDFAGAVNWTTAISDALSFSVVVNGETYGLGATNPAFKFYLASRVDFLALFGEIGATTSGGVSRMQDAISSQDAFIFANSGEFWTATTQSNSSGNAYSKGYNPSTYLRGQAKTTTYRKLFVFDAKSLIS